MGGGVAPRLGCGVRGVSTHSDTVATEKGSDNIGETLYQARAGHRSPMVTAPTYWVYLGGEAGTQGTV